MILFTPLVTPTDAGKKRRANAKPPVMTKIEYFHEDVPLRDFLTKILASLKRQDLFESSWLFQGHELDRGDCFALSYTIPRRVTDQVVISDGKDYKEMVHEASSKLPHEVKVYMVENQVCRLPSACTYCFPADYMMEIGGGDNDAREEEGDDEEVTGSRKKQKVRYFSTHIFTTNVLHTCQTNVPSKEETAQAKIIQELERRYCCEDKQCATTPCYVTGPNADHVHLTHMHLRTWAAAIVVSISAFLVSHLLMLSST